MDHGAMGTVAASVVGQVFERDAPLLRQGQTVRVRLPALGAQEWVGTVTGIENQINASTRTLQFAPPSTSRGPCRAGWRRCWRWTSTRWRTCCWSRGRP